MARNQVQREIKVGNTTLGFKYGMLQVNGKNYEQKIVDGKPTYAEVSNKEVEDRIEIAKRITEKIRDSLDKDKILMEALMTIQPKDLKNLEKLLFKSKKTYKPKTRADACVDMKIGNFILPIVNG